MQVIGMANFQDWIIEKFNPKCNLLISHTSSYNFVQSAGVLVDVK